MVKGSKLTESTGSSLRGFGWYGLIFILLAIFLFNGDEFGIAITSIVAYSILLIGFKSWYDFTEEDIINFGGVYQPFRHKFKEWGIEPGSFIRASIFYILAFAFTWFFLKIINDFYPLGISSILPQQLETTIIYQSCVVTPIETLVFHVMLPLILIREFESYNKISWKVYIPVTFIISQMIFSLFHYSVFKGDISSLFQAFFIGMAFMGIVYSFGISAGISTHLSWNLFVIGVTSGNIIGLQQMTFINDAMILLISVSFSIVMMVKLFKIVKSSMNEKQKVIKYGYGANWRKVDC